MNATQLKYIPDVPEFTMDGVKSALNGVAALSSELSPDLVRDIEHMRFPLYDSGSPEDEKQRQMIADKQANIVAGDVQPSAGYIQTRVQKVIGSRVCDVVGRMRYMKDGKRVTYAQKDFKYDINKGFVALMPS